MSGIIDWNMFSSEIQNAVRSICEKHGVEMKDFKFKPSDYNFGLNISGSVENDEFSGEKADFIKHCFSYGFKPEDYQKTFFYGGKPFVLTGFNTRAPKYPLKAREMGTGRNYRFSNVISFLEAERNG